MLCFIVDNKQNDIGGDSIQLNKVFAATSILGHFAALDFF